MDQNEIRETIETKEASAAEAVTEAAEAGDKKKKKKKGGCLKVEPEIRRKRRRKADA